MNTDLLLRVKAAILDQPSKFDMRFLHTKDGESVNHGDCGTSHCIAGWAQILEKNNSICNGIGGEKAFDVDRESLYRLLFDFGWPKVFMNKYRSLKTKKAKARCAAARIDHFIKTGGLE